MILSPKRIEVPFSIISADYLENKQYISLLCKNLENYTLFYFSPINKIFEAPLNFSLDQCILKLLENYNFIISEDGILAFINKLSNFNPSSCPKKIISMQ